MRSERARGQVPCALPCPASEAGGVRNSLLAFSSRSPRTRPSPGTRPSPWAPGAGRSLNRELLGKEPASPQPDQSPRGTLIPLRRSKAGVTVGSSNSSLRHLSHANCLKESRNKAQVLPNPEPDRWQNFPHASATGAFPSSDPVTAGMTQCGWCVRSTAVVPTYPCEAQSWDTPKPLASLASTVPPTPRAKTVH